MRVVDGRLVLSPREAYEGATSAFRKGDHRNALVLATLLVRGIEARTVGGLGAREVAIIREVKEESDRRLGIAKEVS